MRVKPKAYPTLGQRKVLHFCPKRKLCPKNIHNIGFRFFVECLKRIELTESPKYLKGLKIIKFCFFKFGVKRYKTFFVDTYILTKTARVFVPVKPLQPSLMFEVKAGELEITLRVGTGAYPSEAPFRCYPLLHSRVGSSLTRKH